MSKVPLTALAVWLLCQGCGGPPAQADEAGPAEAKRALILARALAYDTRMAERAGAQIVLAIIYRKGDAVSENQAIEATRAFRRLEGLRVVGLPFRSIAVPYPGPGGLEVLVDRDDADALLLCEGLAGEIPAVRQLARSRKVITAGRSEEQVRAGLSMAVVSESNRMQLIINLPESREQGARFDPTLLRIARVIQ